MGLNRAITPKLGTLGDVRFSTPAKAFAYAAFLRRPYQERWIPNIYTLRISLREMDPEIVTRRRRIVQALGLDAMPSSMRSEVYRKHPVDGEVPIGWVEALRTTEFSDWPITVPVEDPLPPDKSSQQIFKSLRIIKTKRAAIVSSIHRKEFYCETIESLARTMVKVEDDGLQQSLREAMVRAFDSMHAVDNNDTKNWGLLLRSRIDSGILDPNHGLNESF